VTRGRLPQRAGSLGLNGSGAAAMVPLKRSLMRTVEMLKMANCTELDNVFCEQLLSILPESWHKQLACGILLIEFSTSGRDVEKAPNSLPKCRACEEQVTV